jgi:hypothetical protein
LICDETGVCTPSPGECVPVGEPCETDADCCRGLECETFPEEGSVCDVIIKG